MPCDFRRFGRASDELETRNVPRVACDYGPMGHRVNGFLAMDDNSPILWQRPTFTRSADDDPLIPSRQPPIAPNMKRVWVHSSNDHSWQGDRVGTLAFPADYPSDATDEMVQENITTVMPAAAKRPPWWPMLLGVMIPSMILLSLGGAVAWIAKGFRQ